MNMQRAKPKPARAAKTDGDSRRGGARAVSDLLPDIGRAAFRRFGFVQSSIIGRWGEIVGERYARVSAPESIRFPQGERSGGVLTLVVEGAHGTMMQHIAPEIVERVNRFFGYPAVARIQFRNGEPLQGRRPMPARPKSTGVPAELGDSLRDIADPELKAVLEGLASGLGTPEIPRLGRID